MDTPKSPLANIWDFLTAGPLDRAAPLTILEIGCAHGTDTLQLCRCFPNARVFIFEPDPRNIFLLKKSPWIGRVTLTEAAVSDSDAHATMNLSEGTPPKEWGWSKKDLPSWSLSSSLKKPTNHLQSHPWCKFNLTAKVRTVRLDTFAAEHQLDAVDFIWADVQGAEDLVVGGGQQTLARTRYFYTECAVNQPEYEGGLRKDQILQLLPGGAGAWSILADLRDNVLYENRALSGRA